MKQCKTGNNHCNYFHERNKDNLWFIKKYLKSEFMYKYTIIDNMFTIIDLCKLNSINDTKENNKEIKFENLVYKSKKTHKKKRISNNNNKQIYILDKESNIVYHNNNYYGKYEMKHVDKNHVFYDKTKIIKSFYIYDNKNELVLIVYPQLQKYQKMHNVFEDFEEITNKENNSLAIQLDKELSNIKELIKLSKNIDKTKENIIQQYDIKNQIVNIINKLYYSNLDLNKNMYNIINNYLYDIEYISDEYYNSTMDITHTSKLV